MDSHNKFTEDRAKFDEDLTDLINSAAAIASSIISSPSTNPATPSPSMDPRPHNCASHQETAMKRFKLETAVSEATLNVHPSRRALLTSPPTAIPMTGVDFALPSMKNCGQIQLLDMVPLSQRTGYTRTPVGYTLKRKAHDSPGSNLVARRESVISGGSNDPDPIDRHHISTGDKANISMLRSVVQRPLDPNCGDFHYEKLLKSRRMEHLNSAVDRYVPESTMSRNHEMKTRTTPASSFPYSRLPEKIRTRILAFLLVSHEPIAVDYTWLRSFVNGHCRVPKVDKPVKYNNLASAYTVPMEWTQLVRDVDTMRKDCMPFKPALEDRGNMTRRREAPCRGLTTGLLAVSRGVHSQAAFVFYGSNRFRFPVSSSAWMQLESFLATIGPVNVGKLRSITIHSPLWHRGIKEDYLEGAILDLSSPASRFGVVKTSSRDRLLSAIAGSVEALSKAGKLDTFALELEHGLNAERWTGSYSNTRRLIAIAEAEEHVSRKSEGVLLLKALSQSLPSLPVLTVYHQTPVIGKHHLSEFRSQLASVIREAAKYGWKVDQRLQSWRA